MRRNRFVSFFDCLLPAITLLFSLNLAVFFKKIIRFQFTCLVLLSSLLSAGVSFAGSSEFVLSTEEREWLTQNPHIKLATLTDQPPLSMKDSDGKHSGIFADLFEHFSRVIGQTIEHEFLDTTADLHILAKDKGIYGASSVLKSQHHKNGYLLSDPYFFTPFYAFTTKHKLAAFKQPKDLNGKRVAIPRGHRAIAQYLQEIGDVEIVLVESPLEQMQKVIAGEADAMMGYISYPHLIEKYLMVDLVMAFVAESEMGVHVGVNPEHPILQRILNKAIATLSARQIRNITAKWTQISRQESPKIELTEEEKGWLVEHPVIRVGESSSFEPELIKASDGSFTGITPDIYRLLGERLGVQFQIVDDSWPEIIRRTTEKEIDLVALMSKATATDRGLLTIESPINFLTTAFVKKNRNFEIVNDTDLEGLRVAYFKEVVYLRVYFQNRKDSIKAFEADSPLDAFKMLLQGKADVVVGFNHDSYLLLKKGIPEIEPIYVFEGLSANTITAVRSDAPLLASILSKAISSISHQEREQIISKWSWIPKKLKSSLVLNAEEKDWLAAHSVIRLGNSVDWPPFGFINDEGVYSGIAADYMQIIEELIGIKIKPARLNSWKETVDAARVGNVDMLDAVVPTPQRSKFLTFTKPYISYPVVLFAYKNVDYIANMSVLNGQRVTVIAGSALHDILINNHPEFEIVATENAKAGLLAVEKGEASAFIGNLPTASRVISREGISNLKVAGETPYRYDLTIGVNKNMPMLSALLQKALDSIPEEKHNEIYRKWMSVTFEYKADYALFWKILIAIIIVMLLFLFWNRRLAHEITVRQQTESDLNSAKKLIEAANSELKNSQHELETIIENLPAIFFIKDIDGRYLMVNRLYEEEVGVSKLQAIGHNDQEIHSAEVAEAICTKDQQVLVGKVSDTFEESVPHKDGTEHNYLTTKVPLLNEQGNAYALIGMATDITLLKKLQAELVEAKEVAETANQAKSIFLANMSHELRTPLNAILGFSQLMSMDKSATKQQQENLTIINRSGEHLLSMINDVLDLSKIEAGRMELELISVDLPLLLEDIGQMFKVRARDAGLDFWLELDSSLCRHIKTDAGKLRQILINLLGNAVKFTGEGCVSLRARTFALAGDPNRLSLQVEIEDSGPGISAEHQQHIFEPFKQVAGSIADTKGTGLGLAITRSFVELMDGQISVESKPGKGALFRISLPLVAGDTKEDETNVALRAEVHGLESGQPAWRILVVEDNSANRMLLTSLLTQVGFDVLEAENGEQAIEMFQQWQPHFIWMDMRMPVMDGYEATAKIRTLPGGDIKIVAVTADALIEQRSEILNAGCDDVVTKPFENHEIFDCMSKLLGVRYVYEAQELVQQEAGKGVITAEMLDCLSMELLQGLCDAAYELDVKQANLILDKIAATAPEPVDALRRLVDEFDFGRLKKLLSSVISERS